MSGGHLIGRMHLGVINAAVAENCLMDDLISTVMQIPTMNHFKQEVTHYFDLRGTPPLRKALAKFLTRQLQGKRILKALSNLLIFYRRYHPK